MSLCACGCGNLTQIAAKTNNKRGIAKGEPLRFVHGHNNRGKGRALPEGLLIDEIDLALLSNYCWYLDSDGYAVRTEVRGGKSRQVRLHREILNAQAGQIVDHINGNRLDNRRSNLRFASPALNAQNRKPIGKSGALNVHWHKGASRWQVIVWRGGRANYLGLYDTIAEAEMVACAYRAGLKL